MTQNFLVSILMPVYNGELFLHDSIKSILTQTYSNFEFIIYDDGSTDRSIDIISQYDDSRIIVIRSEINRGLVFARNTLVENSNGDFIAFFDCDDISEAHRIETQVSFLLNNSKYSFVASWVTYFGKENHFFKLDSSVFSLKTQLLFSNIICNSSTLIRKSALPDRPFFNSGYAPAEDFDFWSRVLLKSNGYIIPDLLVKYRVHDNNSSRLYIENMNKGEFKVFERIFRIMSIPDLKNFTSKYHQFIYLRKIESPLDFKEAIYILGKLKKYNLMSNLFNRNDLNEKIKYFTQENLSKFFFSKKELGLKFYFFYLQIRFKTNLFHVSRNCFFN